MTFEWTELAYQDAISGNTMFLIFPLCVLLVYGVLAAQYESWSLPLTVILIVPMTLLSAIGGVWLTGGDNNVFTQISFLVLAGLACKNAILIVEFARQRESEGAPRRTAILDACRIRLRPVLMTSVAFIMGVVPLVLATGPGAEVRQAMGIAVFAGMLGVTMFGLVLTPVFYVVVQGLAARLSRRTPAVVPAGSRCRGGSLSRASHSQHSTGCACARASSFSWRGSPALPAPSARRRRHQSCPRPRSPAGTRPRSRNNRTTRAGGVSSTTPCSSNSNRTALAANHDVRSAVARLDQARAVFDEDRRNQYPKVTLGAAVDVREQAQPGFTDEPHAHQHVSRRLRRVVGDGSLRPCPRRGRIRRGQRRERRGGAGQHPRQRRRRRRAELLRAARRCSSGWRCSIAASSTSARRLRLTTVRRDAGIGEEHDVASAAARVAETEVDAAAAAIRAGGAGKPARGADRARTERADHRPGAARVPGAREDDRARAARPTARPAGPMSAPPSVASPRPRRPRASPPRTCIHASRSRACSACSPVVVICSAPPTHARGR